MLSKKPERRVCCVADQHCTAAANFEVGSARGTCFACGEPVCRNCSIISAYYWFGRKRICHNCLIEHAKPNKQAVQNAERRVLQHIYVQSGYAENTFAEYWAFVSSGRTHS